MKCKIGYFLVLLAMVMISGSHQQASAAHILGVTATASTIDGDNVTNLGPQLAVNGAGLDPNDPHGFHQAASGPHSWSSKRAPDQSFIVGSWHMTDLGGLYALDKVDIWNYGGSRSERGFRITDIFLSDAISPGSDFTDPEWTQAYDDVELAKMSPEDTDFLKTDSLVLSGNARHVGFVGVTNWDDSGGTDLGNLKTGVSELQYFGTFIPEPQSCILLAIGMLGVLRLRSGRH